MNKIILTLGIMCNLTIASAQVGIQTSTPGSTLQVNGSVAGQYANISANTYALLETDHYVNWNGTATGTITLPASSPTINKTGRLYYLTNNSTQYTMTVNASGTEQIDGVSSVTVYPGHTLFLVKTNNNTTSGITYNKVSNSNTSLNYLYHVSSVAPITNTQGTETAFNFDTINYSTNGGADFNLTTDIWTCPQSGIYRVDLSESARFPNTTTNVTAHRLIAIYKNATIVSSQYYNWTVLSVSALQTGGGNSTIVLPFEKGDTVRATGVFCNGCGATSMISISRTMTITRIN